MSNIPRHDPLRQDSQRGFPHRGVRGLQFGVGGNDAAKVAGTDVSTSAPVEGQVLVMRDGMLVPEAMPGANHDLLSAAHLNALRVTAASGLNALYAGGAGGLAQQGFGIHAGSF